MEGLKDSTGWPVEATTEGRQSYRGTSYQGKARGWTYQQTLQTGIYGKDTELKVMFHEDSPDTIIQHEAAGAARIESCVLEEEVGAVT